MYPIFNNRYILELFLSERQRSVRPHPTKRIICLRHIVGGRRWWWRRGTADRRIHTRAECSPASALSRWRNNHIVFRILESGVLTDKAQTHIPHRTITVLGYNNLCHTTQIAAVGGSINLVIFGTMDESYHIGILLDGSGFTKVTQLRTLAFFSFTVFHTTIQLRQGNDRDIQLLGQPLQ